MEPARNSKGFTLLEILVVMAIIAILLYLLIQSIAAFRRNIELQQAADQIVTGLNQTASYAGNNILPDGYSVTNDQIYGYVITTESNNLVRKVCSKYITSTLWTCDDATSENLIEDILQNVRTSADCDGILITNLSGDYKIGSFGNFDSDGECTIELSHREDPQVFRKIIFDGLKNNYRTEYAD